MTSPVGVQITKSFTWREQVEEFGNVYHYASEAAGVTESDYIALAQAVANKERAAFAGGVNYLRFRVWGPTDAADKTQIQMLAVGDLTGTGGTGTGGRNIPKELAVCTSVYIGRGPKGGKQILRKYWHVGQVDLTATEDQAKGNTALPSAMTTSFAATFADLFHVTTSLITWDLCNHMGKKVPAGATSVCLPHLHSRNLHR